MNQNASTDSTVSMSFGASAEEISRRAYEIWESEGRPPGCDLRHWLQAEQELSGRHARREEERPRAGDPSTAQPGASEPGQPRNTAVEIRPLQGTRAGAAAQREPARDPKRGTPVPFGADKAGSGNGQNTARRKPANAPVL